ncbi:oligosaccharide flippase family protein [Microbacterium sp. CH12i]|uniref:oligosaccharide flippase family protein n=1 Tax=Microbacterium sp. CH12i TaxID=1479651 RepID=UPI00056BE2BA|nr:oligosaccharide flippase family protein [Microbacterium sp. CH12i]
MAESSLASRAVKGAAWSGLSTILLRLGGLVVGVVLARLLTPEQFGVFAVALTVQTILMTVADLGLSADLIRSEEPEKIAPTVATLGLVTGAAITLLAFFSSTAIAGLLGSPEAAPAIAILSFTLVLGSISVVPYAMLQRRFQQRELFFVGLIDFIVYTVVTLVLVFAGFGVVGLAVGRVAAQLASTTMQFFLARVKPRFAVDRSVVRPVLAFGLPIAGANLLSWALLNVDNIVLVRVAGATALGYYVLAFNISNWPMTALSQVVRSVSLPYLSRIQDRGKGLVTLSALAWTGALPAGAVLAALAAPLIEVVYGAKWLPAAPVLAALGVYGGLRVLFDLFVGFLYSNGRSRAVLVIQVVWLTAVVIGMLMVTPIYGIAGAAWVHVAVAVAIVLPAYLIVLARSGIRMRDLFGALWLPSVAALPAIAFAIWIGLVIQDAVPALLVGGFGAVLVFSITAGPYAYRRFRTARRAVPEFVGAAE